MFPEYIFYVFLEDLITFLLSCRGKKFRTRSSEFLHDMMFLIDLSVRRTSFNDFK